MSKSDEVNLIIDAVFELFEDQKKRFNKTLRLIDFFNSDLKQYRTYYNDVIEKMIDLDYIKQTDTNFFKLTLQGRQVWESGGHMKKLYEENNSKKVEEQDKQLERIKLKFDTKLSIWQVKVFWPMFGMATIGCCTGLISFIWLILKG